jgi:hypothetical protein
VHPRADLRVARPRCLGPHAQAEGDVLEHRHVPEQRVVLEDEADLALARPACRVTSSPWNSTCASLVGEFQAGDDAQQRGLAGAGGPEQRDQFAGRHVEAHVVAAR